MEFHSKIYADGKGPTYGYSPEGCLSRRSWARGKTTDCTYDAWGNVLDESVSVPALATIRYRFQGREWSAATGLVNFRMRWYDPDTGRWLSKDPIGLGGGLNLFMFCGASPLTHTDARGELWAQAAVVVGAGFLFYKMFKFWNKIDEKMDSADINDLSDVMSKGLDCTEDTLTEVTPLFGPPLPDVTLPVQDKVSDALIRPIWKRIFDRIRP